MRHLHILKMSALLFVSVLASAIVAAQCAVFTILPTRAGCTWDGLWYPEGLYFNPNLNPCIDCYCEDGRAMCYVTDCLYPQCVDMVFDPTQCCPTCPNGPNCRAPDRSIIKMGETVQIGGSTCQCKHGGFASIGPVAVCTKPGMKPVVDPLEN